MTRSVLKYLFHFLFMMLIQLLVLNNVFLLNLIHPYLYLLFFLILPVNLNKYTVLIYAFLIGLIMDVFSYTYGLHCIAMTFIGFIRPSLLKLLITEEIEEMQIEPHINTFGFRRYLIYAIILVFIHHTLLYFIQTLSFHSFLFTLTKILINSIFTVIIIFIYELLLFFRKQ
jgi:rod shape-determining protein MreD